MEIKEIDINILKEYKNNAKEHTEEQIEQIAKSIKAFGFNDPIAVDENFTIIEGHGRLLAAKKLGLKKVPVIQLMHLDEAQKKAYILAHNKINMNTGFNKDLLMQELESIFNSGLDFAIIGFEDKYFDEFTIKNTDYDIADSIDNIKIDEDNIVIEEGDIVELGGKHIVICADATIEENVVKLLESAGNNKKHFISDPPYGIAYDPKTNSGKYGMIKNDDVFLDFIPLAKKYTDGFFMIWTSYQVVDYWYAQMRKNFKKITNMIIWHKGGGGLGDCARTLATDYEIALVHNRKNKIQAGRISAMWDDTDRQKQYLSTLSKDEILDIFYKILDGSVVWRVNKDATSSYLHPTQKPVEINEKALINFTKRGEVVVDFFLGSGSNLIACENLDRRCFGFELDPKYMQVIVDRYCEYTNNNKIKINGMSVDWQEYKRGGGAVIENKRYRCLKNCTSLCTSFYRRRDSYSNAA